MQTQLQGIRTKPRAGRRAATSRTGADWTIDQGWEQLHRRKSTPSGRRCSSARRRCCPAAPATNSSRGMQRPADRPRADPRLPAPVRRADASAPAGRWSRCRAWCPTTCSSSTWPTGASRPASSSASRTSSTTCEEPDVFHDVFGHVPMLMNPVIADYIQAYGAGRPARAAARRARQAGARLLVHGGVRPGAAGRRPAHLRRGHRLVGHRDAVLAWKTPRRTAWASTSSA